ncbi:MAG: hypothetical protein DWP98_02450 [Bacteroidetes bacterium]|nr:MAG: hypothetical protein DWP98_02450 [Bacteroidota bacterium]MBL1143952.1 hypothetical protein [Bacteroidota bacterium]MCB0802392.1 addiction module protein [Flavobacteriales bacterium]NOG56753.1 addiction module protein [Bacteroidota bacterium]
MKQVILNIPENKFQFFMELVKNLGFVKAADVSIPEEHKKIVRQRIADSNKNPERLLDWDEVKNDFKLD